MVAISYRFLLIQRKEEWLHQAFVQQLLWFFGMSSLFKKEKNIFNLLKKLHGRQSRMIRFLNAI